MNPLRLILAIIVTCTMLYAAIPRAKPPPYPGNTTILSFSRAKKILLEQVYTDYRKTFYCDCPFKGKSLLPFPGYTPRKQSKRSVRIEWRHVVPAENFGRSFPEWRNGDPRCIGSNGKPYKGRRCAQKNEEFRRMVADLFNIVPAIGEINMLRRNYRYGIIPGKQREFGECDFEVLRKVAEPREEIRGDIARIYFYMDTAYPGRGILSRKNRRLFAAWDNADPVDGWECLRASRIENIQGNSNSFVKLECIASGLWF